LFDSYDANGRLLQTTDANGLRTNYAYDPRGRVSQITLTPPTGTARVTQYTYTAAGDIATVTFPDNRLLTYTYNAARQLMDVTDNLNNVVHSVYDLKGNKIQDYVFGPGQSLV